MYSVFDFRTAISIQTFKYFRSILYRSKLGREITTKIRRKLRRLGRNKCKILNKCLQVCDGCCKYIYTYLD